jgi:tRNA pseudouridine55 synthase
MTAASQRTIPPEIVHTPGSFPDDAQEGAVFPIDKPGRCTSFDVVREVRRLTGVRKVGHAGTLDPMATGLLIVLVARPATRLQDAFMTLPKVYEATMRLGETTASHDAETKVTERRDPSGVTEDALDAARREFVGTLFQVPPMYSAIKKDGEPLYKKARRGETVERPPRQVHIDAFEITGRNGADVSFRVACSKGTYIRSLARDMGEALGVGAHLTALRRMSIGPYSVDEAWTLDALRARVSEPATDDAPRP